MTDLERALVGLGRELDVPDVPDVLPAVLERIEREPRGLAVRRLPRRRLAVAIAIVVVAALGAALAVPEARSALFRVLHIGGERIELVGELPPVESPGLVESSLGERVSTAEARRRAGFRLRELGESPDRVYVVDGRPTVWYVYGAPDEVRLLVAQTPRLVVDGDLILNKLVAPATSVEEVSIAGSVGYFLSGDPHLVLLLDELGNVVEESTRLAGNVLVWEVDGVALRLEGGFTKAEAVKLGESLR
jgi:hypothetical protein